MGQNQLKTMKELMDVRDFRRLKECLVQLQEADIAEFMEELAGEKTVMVFRMLPKELATDVFAFLPAEKQQEIIDSILENLNLDETHYYLFTLTISEQSLQKRFFKDIARGIRKKDSFIESSNRLSLYEEMDSTKIDVSDMTAKEAAGMIALEFGRV